MTISIGKKSPGVKQHKNELVDVLHSGIAAWLVLGISLVLTVIAWQISVSYATRRAVERFNNEVEEAQIAIHKRLTEYEVALRGGIGLFQASNHVDRIKWRRYVNSLQIDKYYPGIQGIGFSEWIIPENKASHISQIREEGFPEYTIRPAGNRSNYSAIVYLEPFDWRNKRAFGYDMYSEKIPTNCDESCA